MKNATNRKFRVQSDIGKPYYYLAFGKPVWRLVGAFLLNVLIVLGLFVLFILAGMALEAVLALLSKFIGLGRSISAIAAIVAVAVALCSYVYILFRLAFLLNPIVIAESRVALWRSWSLSRGNFWRMFAIFLAVLVPAIVLLGVILYFSYGGFMPLLPANATADQINAHREAVAAWSAGAMNRSLAYWYIIYPAYGVYTVLMYGLGCSAQCFAYRALVPGNAA